MWDKATDTLEQSIKLLQESGSTMTVGRLVSGIVLVQLAREDVVAASKAFQAWGGYCDGDQSAAINTIIQVNFFNIMYKIYVFSYVKMIL